MRKRGIWHYTIYLFSIFFLLMQLTGCDNSSGSPAADNSVDEKKPTAAIPGKPVIEYQALLSVFSHPGTEITDVTFEEDGSNRGVPIPAHCIVKGKMNERISPVDGKTYAIGFEMRLPTDWNGRYFYQANGGVDGNIASAFGNLPGGGYALSSGCAVISSDAGHPTRSAAFGVDPQARLDYGYNAVAKLTPMAKSLIKTYYGKFPDKSYIVSERQA